MIKYHLIEIDMNNCYCWSSYLQALNPTFTHVLKNREREGHNNMADMGAGLFWPYSAIQL